MATLTIQCFSESLKRSITLNAVVPVDQRTLDGNGLRDERPMKTLYLLHGAYGNGADWFSFSRLPLWAQDWNLAVIMPSGENKFFSDVAGSEDEFGKFVGQELVEMTRRMFNLSHKREDTFVAGQSMGGYGALMAAFRYPEVFGYVGAFGSALILDNPPLDDRGTRMFSDGGKGAPITRTKFYESVFGPLKDLPREDDYWRMAEDCARKGTMPSIFMSCGTSDALLEPNRKYRDFLQRLGTPLHYEEGEGGHDWVFWDKSLYHFLSWLPLEPMTPARNSGHKFLHL